MKDKEVIVRKKLTYNIKRIDLKGFQCYYQYDFSTRQWLESIDNLEYFGIDHNETKQQVIDALVNEFRIALNAAVFGDQTIKKNQII